MFSTIHTTPIPNPTTLRFVGDEEIAQALRLYDMDAQRKTEDARTGLST